MVWSLWGLSGGGRGVDGGAGGGGGVDSGGDSAGSPRVTVVSEDSSP